jgi:hypothetical protein
MSEKIKVVVTDFKTARFHGLYPASSYRAGEGQVEVEVDKEFYERYKQHLKEHIEITMEVRRLAGFEN